MAPANSTRLAVYEVAGRGARELAGFSQGALDHSLGSPSLAHAAELCVSIATGDALLVGAF